MKKSKLAKLIVLSVLKAGIPLMADCPTIKHEIKNEYIQNIQYDTINLKKDYFLYDSCGKK